MTDGHTAPEPGGRAGSRSLLRPGGASRCDGGSRSAVSSSARSSASRSRCRAAPSGARRRSSISASRSLRSAAVRSRASRRTRGRSGEIIRSESALAAASRGERHPGVASFAPRSRHASSSPSGQVRGINPLIEIAVKGSRQAQGRAGRRRARGAGRRRRVSSYVTEKVELLENQVAVSRGAARGRGGADRRARSEQQDALDQRTSRSRSTQRLLLSPNLNSVITTADARRTALQDDLFEARQLLNLAENVESSRVVEPAAASKTTARSSRTSLLVGALIGLLARRDRRARRRADRRTPARGLRRGLMLDGQAGRGRRARVRRGAPRRRDDPRDPGASSTAIYVVDDALARRDRRAAATSSAIRASRSSGTSATRGVGAAIATGYRRALEEEIDVTCVMAADNQMDPAELEGAGRAGRPGRGRVREGEPARLRRGLEGDPADAVPRERRPLAADEDRVRLLARRRLAGRLHGALARGAAAARPRPPVPALRLPERHARPPERPERARARRPLAADLRRRRAVGDPAALGRAAHLVAPLQGLLVADGRRSTSSATSTRSSSSTRSAC